MDDGRLIEGAYYSLRNRTIMLRKDLFDYDYNPYVAFVLKKQIEIAEYEIEELGKLLKEMNPG